MNHATDFNHLRQAGLDLLRQLASESWTDHNTADPGITILEQLCYALTDLGYRIGFDVVDLLAAGGEKAYRLLYTPRQVLTTKAVVLPDFRRLLLDNTEVKNASFRRAVNPAPKLYYAPFSEELLLQEDKDELLPEDVYRPVHIKGLLQVDVQKEHYADAVALQHWLTKKLHANRLLCSDFEHIRILEEESVKVQLHIELGETKNSELLLAKIWQVLDRYISPVQNFQPLTDLIEEERIENIFEGVPLQFGFLLKEQLRRFQKRQEIRRSDLIQDLMNIGAEIKAIRLLNLAKGNQSFSNAILDWVLPLDEEKSAVFNRQQSEIQFFTENLSVSLDFPAAEAIYQQMAEESLPQPLSVREVDIPLPAGNDRKVGRYTSIRYHLPEVYGITPYGLPETASPTRKAQAKQLSAYLVFFEQILADYFTQLGSLSQLLSVDRTETDQQSYFTQALDEITTVDGNSVEAIPHIQGIYRNTAATRIDHAQQFFAATDEGRNNRLLDHFLARFAEQFFDNIIDPTLPNSNAFDNAISAKRAFLKEYPELSGARATAYDYSATSWETNNVAGTEKRIARLLGLRNYKRQNLAVNGLEGFHLFEHILLRPTSGDQFQNEALLSCLKTADPYSLQVSYIFNAIGRFAQAEKQTFIERLLRAETPAHIRIQTYWLSPKRMDMFERAYQVFLQELKNMKAISDPDSHHFSFRVARDRLQDLLYMFHPDHQAQDPATVGIPLPIRDLPLPTRAPLYQSNVSQNGSGDWVVQIQIYHPQVGVTYRLCDRDRQPISTAAPVSVTASTTIDFDPVQGKPFVFITTPPLDQDETYWIRAEKTLEISTSTGVINKSIRYVFLTKPVRVKVGIAPVGVTALPDEINYGTQANIQLTDIQANVDYRLYGDLDGDGSLELIADVDSNGLPYNGPENGSIVIPTDVNNGLKEDLIIVVRGSRDNFSTAVDVGSTVVRVRANPVLPIVVGSPIIAFGSTSGLSVTALDPGNPTQKSVQYSLFYRELSDPEFVHQKLSPPPDNEVKTIDNGLGLDVKIYRPKIPNLLNNLPDDYIDQPISPISYQLVATLSPNNDGDPVLFDTSGLSITEDTLFLIVASKVGHDQPIVLGDYIQATIGVVLTQPATTPTFLVDPDPVLNGTKGRGAVSNTQAGVKYYLQSADGTKHPFNFQHDTGVSSPRRDGVGFSKVAVDLVAGAVSPLPLLLETQAALTQTTSMQLMAEKIQTSLVLKIADVTFTVTS